MAFLNPSLVQTQFRQQFTNGQSPSVVQYDTQPVFSTFATPTSALQLSSVCIDIEIPSTAVSTQLPIPTAWTKLTKVTIINIDQANGLLVVTVDGTGDEFFTPLPPNGGLYSIDLWPLSNVASSATVGQAPSKWYLWSIDSGTGIVPAADFVTVRLALVGY